VRGYRPVSLVRVAAAPQWYDIITQYRALFASDSQTVPEESSLASATRPYRGGPPERLQGQVPMREMRVRNPCAMPSSPRIQEDAVIVMCADGVARLAPLPANVSPGESFELQAL